MINDSKTSDKIELAYNAYTMPNARSRIKYLHQCLFSPIITTLMSVVENGQLQTFLGLTKTAVQKYLDPSPETSKGHMKRPRKGLQSTSPPVKKTREQLVALQVKVEKLITKNGVTEKGAHNKRQDTEVPNGHLKAVWSQIESNIVSKEIKQEDADKHVFCLAELEENNQNTIYLYLIGIFPYTSLELNVCMLIVYDYITNAILVKPTKNFESTTIFAAFEKTFEY